MSETKTEEKKAAAPTAAAKNPESVYTAKELVEGYRAFKCNRDLVEVALKLAHVDSATFSEARKIVEKFMNKEVLR